MSVDYKGLLQGNISVIDVAKAIALYYGGTGFKFRFGNDSIEDYGFGLGRGIDSGHWVLEFTQEHSDAVKALRPWERSKHAIHRQMHVFTDGACKSDYADITAEPMTYVSLGHWADCKEIINALVYHFGGYVRDEAGSDEFEPMSQTMQVETAARIQARMTALEARDEANFIKAESQER